MSNEENAPLNPNQQSNNEEVITKRLAMVTTMLIVLAFCRLFILDIFSMISDIITAFILYFTYTTRNNFMAIFSLMNGIIGIIFTLAKGIGDMTQLSKHSGIFRFMFIVIFTYALIVYFLVIFYSYKGIKTYGNQMGGWQQQQQGGGYQATSPSPNYGAVTEPPRANYVPFSGKGTTLGSAEAQA